MSKTEIFTNRQPHTSTCVASDSSENRTQGRTIKKQGLETLRLENLWESRLRSLGWSRRASIQSIQSLAQSTLRTYNGFIHTYIQFCEDRQIDFSSDDNVSAVAEFLCHVADKSQRPESVVKGTSAAITCLFEALGKQSPIHNYDIKRLISGIIKSSTSVPMKRSRPMPVQPFIDLFTSWGNNDTLTLKQLRMKAITLLALVCMTRPSDLAPKGVLLNTLDLTVNSIVLSLDNVEFLPDKSLTILFFGIKNDTSRSGFEVNIPQNSNNHYIDPVSCLQCYIHRTQSVRPSDTKPVFLSLKAPFKAISSSTVANILDEVITLAGLSDKGFSAKSFRPTGATLAVNSGILPETVMQIGRWKTKEVFMNHYVYPNAPKSYTENLFTK